jgi:hypothetical protein
MMRVLVVAAALAVLAVVPAQAQNCRIVQSGTTDVSNAGTPQQLTYISFPVVECAGGRRISADNAYLSEASGQLQLLGNVQFRDSARTLTATNAQYFSRMQRLSAQGRVVLVHRGTNSIIRSEQLEYIEATPERESLVQAMGGRPRAVLRQAGAPDSTTLDAMQIEIFGETRMRGTGDALLTRDSLRAQGYVVEYDQAGRALHVTGLGTNVEVPRYRLLGDSITALLSEDEQIREVVARHGAALDAEEMDVEAPALRLFLENGGVSRMVAMNWPARAGGEPSTVRPRVENAEFRMIADSLDVLAPGQRIAEAVAVGDAWGERITPDTMRGLVPEAEPDVQRFIANDWMRGDTVRAFFADAVEGDTAGERVIERLLASGAAAQSLYRMRDENSPSARFSINYLIGTAIEVRFRDGQVAEVSSPDARGMFLQPSDAVRRPGGGAPAAGRSP